MNDAYAQWVAEVMLQQTRVETALAYYERFLRRFPDVQSLARASHEQVLKYWEGLGYYRRALHLHQAVKFLDNRRLPIPSTAEGLRALPGVGDYTAAAIASIAFGQRAAAVDGNVARVLTRVFGIESDTSESNAVAARARVREIASQLIPPSRPGDFNQAWMDLGSLICTPRSPTCPVCPLVDVCVAAQTGPVEGFRSPKRNGSQGSRTLSLVAAAFVHNGRLLVRRRETGGLWSGLWELPTVERRRADPAGRLVRRLAETFGVILEEAPVKKGMVRRELTHRTVTFEVYAARVVPDGAVSGDARTVRWVTRRGLPRLSFSTAHRRVLDLINKFNY